MGLCNSCLKNSSVDYNTPDVETRRRQQVEAAERRQQNQEHRGIKDPEKVRRQQQKAEELERLEAAAARQPDAKDAGGMRWQVS